MICNECKIDKSEQEFTFRRKEKGIRHKRCSLCTRRTTRDWHRNLSIERKSVRNKSKIASRRERTGRYRIELYEYLNSKGCKNCGERNPVVLDFDHINPDEKEFTISAVVGNVSKESLWAEIEKCDVLCANCHRKKTTETSNRIVKSWLLDRGFISGH